MAAQGTGGRRWMVAGAKLMIDGTIDNGTAWLDVPDRFDPTSGRIAEGMRADLTAFTVDPLRAEPDELAHASIAATIVAGSIVHRDPAV